MGVPIQGGNKRQLRAGDVLMVEGEASTEAYRLIEGRLAVSQSQADGPEIPLADVVAGGFVGELAVLAGGERTATVTARRDSIVEAYSKAEFEALLGTDRRLAATVNELAIQRIDQNALRALIEEMVSPISAALMRELEQHISWIRLAAGEVLYGTGDESDGVYYVVSGRLRVDSDRGAAVVGRGTTLGESGLLLANTRRKTVTANRDSGLLHLSRSGFEAVARNHLDGVLHLLEQLGDVATSVRKASDGRAITLVESTPELAAAFLDEIRRHGTVGHLSARIVDAALGLVGASQAEAGDPAEYRLSQFIHQAEVDNDHVVYETDEADSQWSRRATRQSDHVAFFCPADPGAEELRRLERYVALTAEMDQRAKWLVVVHPPDTERPRGTSQLLERLGLISALHVRSGNRDDMARAARIVSGHATGLVFSGGGARGFAHLGAYRALRERDVPIDVVGGSSMGAVMAGFVSLGMGYDDLVEHAQHAFRSLLDYTLPAVSLVKGKRISEGIHENFGDWDFGDTWRPFVCVSTNLTRSESEVHRTGSVARAIRASIAIPGVIPPVASNGDLLVDGGILDNLPIDVVRNEFDPETVIALDVTPERGPTAKTEYGDWVSGWRAFLGRLFRKERYPNTVATLLRSTIAASVRERDRQIGQGRADLYLQLPLRGVGLLEFDRVHEVAEIGYEASVEQVAEWVGRRPAGSGPGMGSGPSPT